MKVMSHKRAETRLRSRGSFRILAEGTHPIHSKLVDTSPSELGLKTEVELGPGTAIRLECSGIEIDTGTVKNCEASGEHFIIDVALSQGETSDSGLDDGASRANRSGPTSPAV
jgi:hypothetical protein